MYTFKDAPTTMSWKFLVVASYVSLPFCTGVGHTTTTAHMELYFTFSTITHKCCCWVGMSSNFNDSSLSLIENRTLVSVFTGKRSIKIKPIKSTKSIKPCVEHVQFIWLRYLKWFYSYNNHSKRPMTIVHIILPWFHSISTSEGWYWCWIILYWSYTDIFISNSHTISICWPESGKVL